MCSVIFYLTCFKRCWFYSSSRQNFANSSTTFSLLHVILFIIDQIIVTIGIGIRQVVYVSSGNLLDDGLVGTGTRSAASIQRVSAPKLSSETNTSTLKSTTENECTENKNRFQLTKQAFYTPYVLVRISIVTKWIQKALRQLQETLEKMCQERAQWNRKGS